jgi:hypothetical protein
MKKTICCILLASTTFAQTAPAAVEAVPVVAETVATPTAPTAEAADAPVKAAKSNAWKGYVFVGVSAVIAVGAIVAVAVSQGASSEH